MIFRVLKKEGFEVDFAFNLAEAHFKLLAKPHIIFLDNYLPDGSGIEYILMHPVEFTQSYVILISADPGTVMQKKACAERIRGFLPKPFSIDLMKELIKPAQFPE